MKARLALMGILVAIAVVSTAFAEDTYIIIIDNLTGNKQAALEGFPGRSWGKNVDKVYLYGGNNELQWLDKHNIASKVVDFKGELSGLFLCYVDDINHYIDDTGIYDYGDDYVLSDHPIAHSSFCRRLSLRNLPFATRGQFITDVLTYHPAIDSLIGEVSRDTIIDYLSKLSGESPIEINGQIDTIHTRFSGTDGNALAARYLKQVLENYGYQTEYHGFHEGELRHVAVYDENRAWVVNENGSAFGTLDGGASWNLLPIGVQSALWGVDNIGPDSVWIAGDGGIIRFSANGGTSFTPQSSGTTAYLFGVSFVNSREGWIAGDNGYVLRTTNGGQQWSRQTTPTTDRLYDICFVDNQYGWAVGRSGTIIHTTDGGANWNPQTANTTERLYGVKFVDRNNGWAVGWAGVVRQTTDGGTNWQSVYLGDSLGKHHVDFVDARHGCIVGFDGGIFITADGGSNWQAIPSGTIKGFYGVEFTDTLTGYAMGGAIIMKTTDGGQTWFRQTGNMEGAWRNVIATKTGTLLPHWQVIICAHFDAISEQPQVRTPGADDNGTGSIAVIEAARVFAGIQFETSIKFCLWTGEEQGLHGSAAYAEEAFGRNDNIIGVFNYDMIGWDSNNDHVGELHCGITNPSIALGNIVEDVINDYELDLSPQLITYGSTNRSDHASFWDYNYPAMLGIEDFNGDFNQYYHTTSDVIANINQPYFLEYTKAVLGAAAALAVPDTTGVGITESEQLPAQFSFIYNYPNPFNSSTTIAFNLVEDSEIELSIYDLLGRKVTMLISGFTATGTHNIVWKADNYGSGLYFYRLTNHKISVAGRMTLLK